MPETASRVLTASRRVMARKARTFHWAAHFLPAAVRDDAAVVYAFCRLVDDTADESRDAALAASGLRTLRREVTGERLPRPLVAEFLATARRVDLPLGSALELIRGAASDLGPVRVGDDAELLRYCYRVAGTVGLMMCSVLRVCSREAAPHAVDLGIAMQLTNIARDVAEDAARDRVYLPADRLLAAGIAPGQLLSGEVDRVALGRVVADVLQVADYYYRSADHGMRAIPWRCRSAILVASRVYRAIGVKLRRHRCDPLRGRTVVAPAERLLWASRALAAGLAPDMLGLTRKPPHDARLHRHLSGLTGAHTEGTMQDGPLDLIRAR